MFDRTLRKCAVLLVIAFSVSGAGKKRADN